MTFTMDDLVTKFEKLNLLCTLVCAGNRRKEQNMVKKTKGFNWGASGTGTGQISHSIQHTVVLLPRLDSPLHMHLCTFGFTSVMHGLSYIHRSR